jgi:hypothetical protein
MTPDDEEAEKDRDLELLQRTATNLIGHFDTVQIFATRHAPISEGGTVNCQWGLGNWYARFGQVSMWLHREMASECHRRVREDDEGDD